MVSIQHEEWARYYPDCLPLWQQHHAELQALVDPRPLRPDIVMGESLSRTGQMQITTARDGKRMVGNTLFFITPDLTSLGATAATQSLWYVDPEYRGGTVAVRLFDFAVKSLWRCGVANIFPHHWLTGDSPKAERIIRRYGGKPVELVYLMTRRDQDGVL